MRTSLAVRKNSWKRSLTRVCAEIAESAGVVRVYVVFTEPQPATVMAAVMNVAALVARSVRGVPRLLVVTYVDQIIGVFLVIDQVPARGGRAQCHHGTA